MIVTRCDYDLARQHVEEHHYSGCMPRGRNLCFAAYLGGTRLYAVAVYGNGVNPYQPRYLTQVTGLEVKDHSDYVELKRLARGSKQDVSLTTMLARCHRMLRRMEQPPKVVISFSDPEHGHTGGIYRAANFIYAGQTQAERHCVDADGNPVHRRRAYRYAKAHDITIAEAREALGLRIIKTLPKTRWILPLRRRDRRRVEQALACLTQASDNK